MDRLWFNEDLLGLLIPILAIVGFAAYAIVNSVTRTRLRELEVRERIMMIEKGLVPPPEVDPRAFEQQMSRFSPAHDYDRYRAYRRRHSGFTMVAIGLAMMVMFYPNFRIGGFLFVFGMCYLIASMFDPAPERPRPPESPGPRP